MWDEFYKDIDGEEFDTWEDYENWVSGWVEDSINECSRLGRYSLGLSKEQAEDELNIKINEKGEEND